MIFCHHQRFATSDAYKKIFSYLETVKHEKVIHGIRFKFMLKVIDTKEAFCDIPMRVQKVGAFLFLHKYIFILL